MSSSGDGMLPWLAALNGWEALAVLLGLAYLLLATRESLWCWYAGLLSSSIYVVLMWQAGLVMESGLQVYYAGMAVYGWWHWKRGQGARQEGLPISVWAWQQHAFAITAILIFSLVTGFILSGFSIAQRPYIDSFVTWSSILTTWMVTQKLLENWLYWFVVDSLSLALYVDRGLYLTALLFALYLVLVVFGFLQWWQHYREQRAAVSAQAPG